MSPDNDSRISFWLYNSLIRSSLDIFVKQRGHGFLDPIPRYYSEILSRVQQSDLCSDLHQEQDGIRHLWHFIRYSTRLKNISQQENGRIIASAVDNLDTALESEFGKERAQRIIIKNKIKEVRGQTVVLGILNLNRRKNKEAMTLFRRYKYYVTQFDRQSLRCHLERLTNDTQFVRQNSYPKLLEKVVKLVKMILDVAEKPFIMKVAEIHYKAKNLEKQTDNGDDESENEDDIQDSEHFEDTLEQEDVFMEEIDNVGMEECTTIQDDDSDILEINENSPPAVERENASVILQKKSTVNKQRGIKMPKNVFPSRKFIPRTSPGRLSSTSSRFTSVTGTNVGVPRHKKHFTCVQDAYIILGVQEFGVGKWKDILNHYSFPEYRNNTHIKDRWRTLLTKKHVSLVNKQLVLSDRYQSLVSYVEKQRQNETKQKSSGKRKMFNRARRLLSSSSSESLEGFKESHRQSHELSDVENEELMEKELDAMDFLESSVRKKKIENFNELEHSKQQYEIEIEDSPEDLEFNEQQPMTSKNLKLFPKKKRMNSSGDSERLGSSIRKRKGDAMEHSKQQREIEIEDSSEDLEYNEQPPIRSKNLKLFPKKKRVNSSSDSERLESSKKKKEGGELEHFKELQEVEIEDTAEIQAIDEEQPMTSKNLKLFPKKKRVNSSGDSERLGSFIRKRKGDAMEHSKQQREIEIEDSPENLEYNEQQPIRSKNFKLFPKKKRVNSSSDSERLESSKKKKEGGELEHFKELQEVEIEDTAEIQAIDEEQPMTSKNLKVFPKKKRVNSFSRSERLENSIQKEKVEKGGQLKHSKREQEVEKEDMLENEKQQLLGLEKLKLIPRKKRVKSSSDSESFVRKKFGKSDALVHSKQVQETSDSETSGRLSVGCIQEFDEDNQIVVDDIPFSGSPVLDPKENETSRDPALDPGESFRDDVLSQPGGALVEDRESAVNSPPEDSQVASQFSPPDPDVLPEGSQVIIDLHPEESLDLIQDKFPPFVKNQGRKYAPSEETQSVASSDYATADDDIIRENQELDVEADVEMNLSSNQEEDDSQKTQHNLDAQVKSEPLDLDESTIFRVYHLPSTSYASSVRGESGIAGASQDIKSEIKTEWRLPKNKFRKRRKLADIDDSEGVSLQWPEEQETNIVSPPPEMARKTRKSRRKWTLEKDKLLFEGVERFGAGSWKEILSSYSFGNLTTVQLKDRYRILKKNSATT